VRKKVNQFGTTDIVKLIESPGEKAFGFASSNFYPEFLAAVEIYRDAASYFPQLEIDPVLTLKSYTVPSAMGINALARQVGVDVEALKGVNYALASSVWTGRATVPRGFTLYIPTGGTVALARMRALGDAAPAPKGPTTSTVYSGSTYIVRAGDSLISIAKKFNVSPAQLLALNPNDGQAFRVGQKLVVQPGPQIEGSAKQSAKLSAKPSGASMVREARYHTVKKGETLSSIAKRYSVSVKALQTTNGMRSSRLSVGQKVRVP
jgi:membrane-bound lytic murein transglycosylase D